MRDISFKEKNGDYKKSLCISKFVRLGSLVDILDFVRKGIESFVPFAPLE